MNDLPVYPDVTANEQPRLYQAGQLVDADTLTTWRSYTLRTSMLSLSPRDAVRSQRITDDTYLLSTGGWMGELKIRVDEGAFTLRISDPKFSNQAWGRLLDDLADAVAALPLAEHVDGSAVQAVPGPATRFVQRLVLRAYAQQILSAVQAIARRPHEALENEPEWTTPDRATTATPAALAAALQRGDFITSGAVAARLDGAAPAAWLDQRQRRHADTPENRFARHALEVMLELTRWFPHDEVLAPLTMEIRSALTRPPFRDAGPYRRLPRSSRVLQRRFGYRELRDAFLALARAARIRWDGLDAAIRGGPWLA